MVIEYTRDILSAMILLIPVIHFDYKPNELLIISPHKIRWRSLALEDLVATFFVLVLVAFLSI